MAFVARLPSSSAVRIVNPATQDDKLKPQSRKDSTQRQCRNVLIYGSCKYEGKGCVYAHPASQDNYTPSSGKSTLARPDSPATALTAQAVNAPVFVPKSAASTTSLFTRPVQSPTSPPPGFRGAHLHSPAPISGIVTPTPTPPPQLRSQPPSQSQSPAPSHEYQQEDQIVQPQEPEHEPYDHYAIPDWSFHGFTAPNQAGFNGTSPPYDFNPTVAYPALTYTRQPLSYHLYTAPPPSAFAPTHFVPDNLREELLARSEAIYAGGVNEGSGLPDELQGYHSLVPLESVGGERRNFGSWYSTVYRAVNMNDGNVYVLRRIENYRMMHQAAFSAIETWSQIRHPSIVSVKEAFTTRAFNDNSLVVVYPYHPNARTLFDAHFKPKPPTMHQGRLQASPTMIPEQTLWSYIIQIAGAIKKVHDAGCALRMIDVTKILVTGKNRVRISSCGVVDVLMYDARQDLVLLQQEDLAMFGRLLFALSCNNVAAVNNLPKSLETISRLYSQDLQKVALWLIQKPGPHKTVATLLDLIGNRLLTELDEAHNAVDRLESELMSELENARLVRLLCKFGFINERPEFAREPRWSETGDRYIIKLFRDFVFHQVDENGNPVVNLSHVLTCLNKLDAGTDERIMLISRDEQSCLVVSYREVKNCVEAAFGDLARGSNVR